MLYEYAVQRVKGIKQSFDNAMSKGIDAYMDNRIVDIYTTTEQFEIYTSTEGMSGAKQLADLESPPILDLNDGYSVQIEENRFGGAILLSEREYKREPQDSTTGVDSALKRKRNSLLIANKRLFLDEMFRFLNEAFSATPKYLCPDGVKLCGTHSWKTAGAATWANADVDVFSEAAVDKIVEYGGAFVGPDGKPNPINFDTIIVKKGSAAAKLAKMLFAYGINPIHVADINIYEGAYTIIETPYITNKLHWFMRDSQFAYGNSLKLGVGLYPTLNEPIRQNNEGILTNCTGFWKQGVCNLPIDWFGCTGAGA